MLPYGTAVSQAMEPVSAWAMSRSGVWIGSIFRIVVGLAKG